MLPSTPLSLIITIAPARAAGNLVRIIAMLAVWGAEGCDPLHTAKQGFVVARYHLPQGSRRLLSHFGPDLEFLGPGSSVLGGNDMIAAAMEEVVDLIVG